MTIPRPFDYAQVSLDLDHFQLRFTRGRGELRIHIAPKDSPDCLHELMLVLNVLDGQDDIQPVLFVDLDQAARLLQPEINKLSECFASGNFSQLKGKLDEIYKYDRAVIRQLEADVNSRLYGGHR